MNSAKSGFFRSLPRLLLIIGLVAVVAAATLLLTLHLSPRGSHPGHLYTEDAAEFEQQLGAPPLFPGFLAANESATDTSFLLVHEIHNPDGTYANLTDQSLWERLEYTASRSDGTAATLTLYCSAEDRRATHDWCDTGDIAVVGGNEVRYRLVDSTQTEGVPVNLEIAFEYQSFYGAYSTTFALPAVQGWQQSGMEGVQPYIDQAWADFQTLLVTE